MKIFIYIMLFSFLIGCTNEIQSEQIKCINICDNTNSHCMNHMRRNNEFQCIPVVLKCLELCKVSAVASASASSN